MTVDPAVLGLLIGIAGGAISALMAWLADTSTEPFNPKKFIAGLIRGGIGGVVVALGLGLRVIDVQTGAVMFLAAYGIDSVTNKVTGLIR